MVLVTCTNRYKGPVDLVNFWQQRPPVYRSVMPAHQKQYKSAEFIESSDVNMDNAAPPGAAHDEESIDSPTLIDGTSFLQDSIDRKLDEAVALEQTLQLI